jgi:hypothetical protein
MRRKSVTILRSALIGYDVRKDTNSSHLAIIGAVTIAWNDVEALVDSVLCGAADVPAMLRLDITSRINGFDGKIAIIKKAARDHVYFPKAICVMIEATCGACEEHKRYRDGIIHARILDPHDAVAETTQRKGKTDEVLITEPALNALYDRLIAIQDELSEILSLVYVMKQRRNFQRKGISGRLKLQIEQAVRRGQALLRDRQKTRLSLPPLPQFPEGRPGQLGTDKSDFPKGR